MLAVVQAIVAVARYRSSWQLCTSRHLLRADCASFQNTMVISIYVPRARWAGVRGTVQHAFMSNRFEN